MNEKGMPDCHIVIYEVN